MLCGKKGVCVCTQVCLLEVENTIQLKYLISSKHHHCSEGCLSIWSLSSSSFFLHLKHVLKVEQSENTIFIYITAFFNKMFFVAVNWNR